MRDKTNLLRASKREYDLLLKKLENKEYLFRKDKYDVYFIPQYFEDEIVSKMDKDDFKSYGAGAGGELKEHKNLTPPPMSSVASSSRFCYLSLKDSDLSVFGITKGKYRRKFEQKLPISGVGGIPPHMDAYYQDDDGGYYFFECKCHEQFDEHPLLLSVSYFDKGLIVDRIDSSFFIRNKTKTNKKTGKISIYREYDPSCFNLSMNPRFDIKQLLTHTMGIQSKIQHEKRLNKKVREIKLIYFYFIPDKVRSNADINSVINSMIEDARKAFSSLKEKLETEITFELYVQYSDCVETAAKNNTKRVI